MVLCPSSRGSVLRAKLTFRLFNVLSDDTLNKYFELKSFTHVNKLTIVNH
jgi:hypothetical protein